MISERKREREREMANRSLEGLSFWLWQRLPTDWEVVELMVIPKKRISASFTLPDFEILLCVTYFVLVVPKECALQEKRDSRDKRCKWCWENVRQEDDSDITKKRTHRVSLLKQQVHHQDRRWYCIHPWCPSLFFSLSFFLKPRNKEVSLSSLVSMSLVLIVWSRLLTSSSFLCR